MQRKNMWKEYTEDQQKELEELSVRYKECLDIGKTERECVKLGKKMADTWGYQNLEECISKGITLKAGDKVYADCMGKAFVMFQLGKKPLEEGMNILSLLKLLGGLGLFLYGMLTMGNALEKMAGEKLEKTLETVTGNIFKAVGVGALVTGIIQS